MNPVVQELAKQARYDSLLEKYYLQEVHKTKITPTEYQNIYNKKFAELIVRQCGYYADVFESLGCPVDMDPTETKPSDYIKKHFGVEE